MHEPGQLQPPTPRVMWPLSPCYTVPPRVVRRAMPRANYAANLIAELVKRERKKKKEKR